MFDQLYGDFLPIGAWLSDVQLTASPTNSFAGLSVQFDCPNMDSQGNIITNWNWTFGDGATSTNQNPAHIYANSGSFQPFLIAINNSGTAFPGYGSSVTVDRVHFSGPVHELVLGHG